LENETDPAVRPRVALPLVTAGKEKDVVPVLIRLLGELPQAQGWQAEEVLCRLAGDAGPKVSLGGDEASRRGARDAWEAWWQKNQASVDLAKLEQSSRLLGHTLVLEMEPKTGKGRVVEYGADKKERWRIGDLMYPMDAQVLPNGRVLVAEHNKNLVSERTMDGKIAWQHAVAMPVNVARLPNGNTFIAARSLLTELDRNGKAVFEHQRADHDIVAATKLRSGHYLFMTNTNRCIRIDAKGQVQHQFGLPRVNYYSGLQVLPNNHVLLTEWNRVAEYNPENAAKPVWASGQITTPSSVQRLPNGNTLICSMGQMRVFELSRDGTEVWSYKSVDGARPWRAYRR
jgi:hypothetical protein